MRLACFRCESRRCLWKHQLSRFQITKDRKTSDIQAQRLRRALNTGPGFRMTEVSFSVSPMAKVGPRVPVLLLEAASSRNLVKFTGRYPAWPRLRCGAGRFSLSAIWDRSHQLLQRPDRTHSPLRPPSSGAAAGRPSTARGARRARRERAAAISTSMTSGSFSLGPTRMPALPFSNSAGFEPSMTVKTIWTFSSRRGCCGVR